MTVAKDLRILADDCEELMKAEACDKGMQRALVSIIYRIRHAALRLEETQPVANP